jgi:hypothetical protein
MKLGVGAPFVEKRVGVGLSMLKNNGGGVQRAVGGLGRPAEELGGGGEVSRQSVSHGQGN